MPHGMAETPHSVDFPFLSEPPGNPGLDNWGQGLCESGVTFTMGVVGLIMELAQHDPPAPRDPAIRLPTLTEARWAHLDLAVCSIVNTFKRIKMDPAEDESAGKSLCQPFRALQNHCGLPIIMWMSEHAQSYALSTGEQAVTQGTLCVAPVGFAHASRVSTVT